ncbi:hypothetical protein BH09ACT10_BH09ACT10_08640 [soil metagenome]
MAGSSGGGHRRWNARRFVRTFGVVLILTGVGFLGYVGLQYFGTNIVAKHAQAQVKTEIQQSWAKEDDGDSVGLPRIARFGKTFEVPINRTFSKNALSSGVGWYEKGALPGQIGNFVVGGHRVTHGEPFRDFPQLRTGDKVEVETRTQVYVYALRDNGTDRTVDYTAGWVLKPDPIARSATASKPVLTLLTCSELFHTRNRNVVFGDLVSATAKTTQ